MYGKYTYLLLPLTSLLLTLLSSDCLKLMKFDFDSNPLTIFSMLFSSLSGELFEAEDSLGESRDLSDLGDTDGDFTFDCKFGLDGLDPRFDKFGNTASKAEPIDELLVKPGGTRGKE